MAVVFVSLLFWPTMGVRLSNLERLQTTAMPLCDASIVQETCDLLTGEDGSLTVTAEQLQKLLVSNEVSTSDLWRALHFDLKTSVTCQSVCYSIVDLLNKLNECPPSSDVGCILDDSDNLRCDIDLSPVKMKAIARLTRGDMPDFHDSQILDKNKEQYLGMGRKIAEPSIFYGLEEVVQRTANLFRIYPRELEVDVFYAAMQPSFGMELNGSTFVSAGCVSTCYDETYCKKPRCMTCAMCQTRVSIDPGGSECASYCFSPSHCVQYPSGCGKCSFCKPPPHQKNKKRQQKMAPIRALVLSSYTIGPPRLPPPNNQYARPSVGEIIRQRKMQAQAYVTRAIRSFNEGKTSRLLRKWFGGNVYTSKRVQKKVQMTLNSVNNVLASASFIYPAPDCGGQVYAYVEPDGPDSRDRQGRFLLFLCPFFMRSPMSEQIETLVHEASHHAVSYLDDVRFEGKDAYGRNICELLAIRQPQKALDNADNFCYYVHDATDDSS
jgi:hypothetical protein